MNINKHNYEAFFLDYHEGNLTPNEVAELLLFLELHPELKEEFETFENIRLGEILPVEFENKQELKKSLKLTPSSLREDGGEVMIAHIEGVLTKDEKSLFEKVLSADIKLQHEFSLYQKTKLIPDATVIFEDKASLRRREKKVVPLHYYVAAAASVLLLMGLFFMVNDNGVDPTLADKEVQSAKLKVESQPSAVRSQKIEELVLVVESQQPGIKSQELKNQKPEVRSEKSEEKSQKPENGEVVVANNEKNDSKFGIHEDSLFVESAKKNPIMTDNTDPVRETQLNAGAPNTKKKNDGFKKLNGWNLAQLAAKKFNKLTGRNVEVKPTYNDEGDVTAYSITAGEFQLTRGR